MSHKMISKIHGAATLILTVILMVAALLILLFMAQYSVLQQKSVTNQYASDQAYEAAEAGLEFGIAFLRQNKATILANPVSGYINYGPSNSSITNVTLANNSSFSIVYTNPTANNYDLIQITATGTSTDNTATKTIRQQFQYQPILATIPPNPTTALGEVTLGGTAEITNNQGNTTIVSGSTISYTGNSLSTSNSGTSNSTSTGSDIQQNNSALSSLTSDEFFLTYFGAPLSTIQNMVSLYYPSGSSPNINGVTGASILINQSFSLSSNTTIGSAIAPVLLIVNGDLNISGNVTIYGFIYVNGSSGITNLTGTMEIIGGLVSAGTLSLTGTPNITYDSSVLSQTSLNTGVYAKVPGSWRDY